MTTATKEQYLASICRLGGETAEVGLAALGDDLGVSPPSVNEMVKKLAALDLVTYEPYRGVTLTTAGRTEALRLIRRHRLWERFLTDVLHLPWHEVHAEACRLEHATSALVEDHLAGYLGEPEACPHGHPMPTPDGTVHFEAGSPMTDLVPGEQAVVLRVPEADDALLEYIGALGLAPETRLQVRAVAPFDGPLTVDVGETRQVIGHEVAARIVVRRIAPAREARDE